MPIMPPAPDGHAAPGTRIRVLVVDDDDTLRKALRIALSEEGYELLEAADGLAALSILQAVSTPLVVLTDHVMPHLDGPGLLAAAARDPVLASRHVYLYMSGRTHPPSADFARVLAQLQVVRIRKPLKLALLLATIATATQRLPGRTQEGVTAS